MRYYIIAGEASGDLHGSNYIKALKNLDPQADIRCWGGDLMESAGGTLVKHYRDLAFMGFAEVIKNLPTILRNIKFCKEDILSFKPDVIVLIDYPGFNLRIAEWAHEQKIKTVFYISPQVWAWKESRVKKMRQYIDKLLVILPFEKEYYKSKWNWDVEYVGHPLLNVIENAPRPQTTFSFKPIVAVLPGSRKQEIQVKLPVMLEVSKNFPGHQFIVAQAPGLDASFYEPFLRPYPNVSTVNNNTYSLLQQSSAAMVTSGTATLETALFGVPEVVCYKGSRISYEIAKRLIKIKFISLVNLIMDREIVKELIQQEMNSKNISSELKDLLFNENRKSQLQKDYSDLKEKLRAGGDASAKAAEATLRLLSE